MKDADAVSKKSKVHISLQGSITIRQATSLTTGQVRTTGSFFSPLVLNDAQMTLQRPKLNFLMTHHMCWTSYQLNDWSGAN
jgi:hypothetical protein